MISLIFNIIDKMSQLNINELPTDMHRLIISELDWTQIRILSKYWKQLMDDIELKRDTITIITKTSMLEFLNSKPENFSILSLDLNLRSITIHDIFCNKVTGSNEYISLNCSGSSLIFYKAFIKRRDLISDIHRHQYCYLVPGYEFIDYMIRQHPLSRYNSDFICHRIYITIKYYYNILKRVSYYALSYYLRLFIQSLQLGDTSSVITNDITEIELHLKHILPN